MFFRFFIFACCIWGSLIAQSIDIGLFYQKKIKKLTIAVEQGEYQIPFLEEWIFEPSDILEVEYSDQTFFLTFKEEVYEVDLFSFEALDTDSVVRITILDEEPITRSYSADLFFLTEKSQASIIAKVNFSDYLQAVIQAEAGFNRHPEFYKVQAVISRTYSIKNWNKHAAEGFNLCDQVHCQAFKGWLKADSIIQQAVSATRDLVVINQQNALIDALFFSNSGGQTLDSEHYWLHPVDHLRSVTDHYSVGQPNYLWEKKVNKRLFYEYLVKEFSLTVPEREWDQQFQHQHPHRSMYLGNPTLKILLRKVRIDWNLRSTFFTVEDQGDHLLLKGKGYGHGVGLSQEGAMNMANQGHSCFDILRYYYKGVQVKKVDFDTLIMTKSQ